MQLDPDGILRFTAVVTIDNLDFVVPAGDPVDGQGHWHLFVNESYVAPAGLYHEAEFADQTPDTGGTLHTLKVRLQQNDHAELGCIATSECADGDVEDRIEFTLDAPADTDDGT